MAYVLLVDGYNVIGNWDELIQAKEQSLEEARARLCGVLSRYLSYRWDRIIVVFDAYNVAGGRQSDPGEAPFTVLFSNEGESADLAIERLTETLVKEGHTVEVATSDALEQILILGKGATRISARELRLVLQELDREIEDKYNKTGPSRLMLDSALDGRTKEVFERWRRKH